MYAARYCGDEICPPQGGGLNLRFGKSSTDGSIPFFTRDELPHDAAALLEVDGQTVVPPRTGRPGRPRSAYKVPPDDLLYAVVNKRRKHGRVVAVTTHVVSGTPARLAQVLTDSPVSRVISTLGVERNHWTIRQHARRMGRKVQAFSKDHTYLEYHLALSFAYDHFMIPHRGLRHGSRCNRPPLDHGRTLELSCATAVCLAIDTKSPTL